MELEWEERFAAKPFANAISLLSLVMRPYKSLSIALFVFVTVVSACESTQTAKEQEIGTEYPGGEEAYVPYGGHIDRVYRTFSGIEPDAYSPSIAIGGEKWTCRWFDPEVEIVFVTFQTGQSLHERQFVLERDTLIYAEEKETLLPAQEGNMRSYTYVIAKDTVVAFMPESTGGLELDSEAVKTTEIFKMWESHRAHFKQAKASFGFDGIKDVAAMGIYEDFRLEYSNHYGKYTDAETPLKVTISYSTQGKPDSVFQCNTDAEKEHFFRHAYKIRGKSRLASTHGNKAVFTFHSPKPKVFLQELVFSDEMLLLEVRLMDVLGE